MLNHTDQQWTENNISKQEQQQKTVIEFRVNLIEINIHFEKKNRGLAGHSLNIEVSYEN